MSNTEKTFMQRFTEVYEDRGAEGLFAWLKESTSIISNAIDHSIKTSLTSSSHLVTIATTEPHANAASLLAMNITDHIATNDGLGITVLYPGRSSRWYERALRACGAGIPHATLASGQLDHQQRERLEEYNRRFHAAPLMISNYQQLPYDQAAATASKIDAKIIVIDSILHLDYPDPGCEHWDPQWEQVRHEQLETLATDLKRLSRDEKKSIIAVTRQSETGKLGGEAYDAFLRESDLVLNIDPAGRSTESQLYEVRVSKNRHGRTGAWSLMTLEGTMHHLAEIESARSDSGLS